MVTSPFDNFNSAIACSLVNPFFVISLMTFSGKGDGVGGGKAAAAAAAEGEGGWFNRCWRRLSAKKWRKTDKD